MPDKNPNDAVSEQDIKAAQQAATLALLREIPRRADAGAPAIALLALAEAYAWLQRPDQPHGMHPSPPRLPVGTS
jgi:hypothetical protein